MSGEAIRIDNLTVRYGRKTAVDGVSLGVMPGNVYALLGRNGAGKSSLVRCVLGEQKPERGAAALLGEDSWTNRTSLMRRVGVVAEEADAPPAMRVHALARFSSSLYPRWDRKAFDERLARFSVSERARFGDLSKGQKKQVSVALALAHEPELLVLDDPTLGLDVVARKSLFEEVIAELADRGTTVFITTHDLAGVETIVDRVAMMANGRIVVDEEIESLKARFRRVRFAVSRPAVAGNLATAAVRNWGTGTEMIVTNYDPAAHIDAAEVSPMSLEEIFIAVTGEEGSAQ
ncbi:MAG TPA: ABC transporter ATP-binding protein [Thermoanaerobaculia bacterium]|jgi:ABC-2 type transport system ATP-binding protein|nr:ABC transporter ATP-binding protein [Thermoanaerobaculia bacterium]